MKVHESAVDQWGIMKGYTDGQKRLRRISSPTRDKLRATMGDAPDGTGDTPAMSPTHCHLPKHAQEWGWAVQLYSLRSRRSWGMGDFADLRRFARWAHQELGTQFLLLNPLGAALPLPAQNASPYYPSSRLFLNPLYLGVDEVSGAVDADASLRKLAEAARALNADRLINRDAIFRLKMHALEQIHRRFHGHRAYDRYCAGQGETLSQFATFCALAEHHGSGWQQWPAHFRHPSAPAVRDFAARHAGRVQFHQWLQWQLDAQFARAARELPLMLDVPIGVDPNGFDAWLWQDLLALDASIGAPPDAFNADGQNWGLPPFIPHRLRAAHYEPFRQTIRAMLRHAKGLRIDHVMGLFRLFWIPRGEKPGAGAYVCYNADEMLAVLASESRRAQAIVVGEDLGTVEEGVRPKLRRHGVLSYRLFWFENKPPERYPAQALAALTTHDLFTVAGLWTGSDLASQQRAGLATNAAGTRCIRQRLARAARLPKNVSVPTAILGAHRLLTRTPCRLITATLDDALAVEERPNMPGTTTQWPNWCLALPKPLEEIQRDPFIRQLAQTMKGETRPKTRRSGPKARTKPA